MNQTKTNAVEISECRLRLSRAFPAHEAPPLRDVFGREVEEEVRGHSRGPDGELLFEYPRVQFKLLDRTAVLMGINEGSQLLRRLWPDIDESQLGDQRLEVLDAQFETREEPVQVAAEPVAYRFLTPWLALNQKNFHEYTRSRNQKFRKDELSRILAGNCLGLAKSLGIRFSDYVTADCGRLTSIKTNLNGKGMIGFVGKFAINLAIPDHLGLGKSVGRGFGTIVSC